jgi:radical SAM protein with 4Fe4S-binding SPASM domain
MPVRLWIEITNRCNLKCRFCVNKDIPSALKGDMDFNLYKKIINEATGSVYDINLFHRGEPLLHPKLIPIISYAKNRGIKTRIHTNATLLNPELSKKIILSGLDLISFSFDGYTKKTYEKNRTGASYEKSLNNIIDFLRIKKELKSKKPFTIIQVMEFNDKLSMEEIMEQKKKFLKKFSNLPLNKLATRTPHNWGGFLKQKELGKNYEENKRTISCTFPWYSLTIFYNGKVFLCPQDFLGKILLGDLNKNSIEEIFNNKAIKDIRKKFKTSEMNKITPCKDCDRIRRRTFLGIPKEYIGIFLKENLRR